MVVFGLGVEDGGLLVEVECVGVVGWFGEGGVGVLRPKGAVWAAGDGGVGAVGPGGVVWATGGIGIVS